MFVQTFVKLTVTCFGYEFDFIHLSWEETTAATYVYICKLCKKKITTVSTRLRVNAYAWCNWISIERLCVYLRIREGGRRKKSLLLNVYARGITIRQARRTFDIINVHIHKKQLSFVFIFFSVFDSFNHLSSTTMKPIRS